MKIPIDVWSKFRTRIENAHIFYREKIYTDKERKISCIFVSGKTGVGKSTFMKKWCKERGKTFCVSSSSNDPLQDYKGEDVLSFEELTDDIFKFEDMLKILDNHTKSSSKSRYHNKYFIGDTIIITTREPIENWYQFELPETLHQLYRRLSTIYKISDKYIEEFNWSPENKRYIQGDTFDNTLLDEYKKGIQKVSLARDLNLKIAVPERNSNALFGL